MSAVSTPDMARAIHRVGSDFEFTSSEGCPVTIRQHGDAVKTQLYPHELQTQGSGDTFSAQVAAEGKAQALAEHDRPLLIQIWDLLISGWLGARRGVYGINGISNT